MFGSERSNLVPCATNLQTDPLTHIASRSFSVQAAWIPVALRLGVLQDALAVTRVRAADPSPIREACMKNAIILLVVLALGGGAAYLFIFKPGQASRLAKGYKPADTAQAAADMFTKAVKARDYDIAADYCAKEYGEQLKRGHDAAKALGTALDNLTYQLTERGLMRDEMKSVLLGLDPFPKDITILVGKESGENCAATLTFQGYVSGSSPQSQGVWQLDPLVSNVFARPLPFKTPISVAVNLKKDKEGWKFEFPAITDLQVRVGRLNEKYKNYTNPLEVVTQEVKNDPSTKENVASRLKTLLEQAAKE